MKSFIRFLIEESEKEGKFRDDDYKTISEKCDVSSLGLTWFTVSVKLAIAANNPQSKWFNQMTPWSFEVDAMLTAYYKCGAITAEEYCTYRNTFYHLMRCSYRAKRIYGHNGERK